MKQIQTPAIDRRRALAALAALGVLAPLARPARAQDYPTRSIRWIVPYLAGTAPDQTVRIVAEAMAAQLGQPVVVDNKGGVAGNLGAQLAARAPADGYTWVYSATTMATNMRMYRKPGFDVMKDFSHIGRIATSDLLVIVHPDSGVNNLRDLLERLKRSPGQLSYASGGIGTPAHMGTELILNASGTEALHVPFKGASESVNAVMGRQVDFALTISSVSYAHVQGGKLRALAVTGARRNARLGQVPTLQEAGLAGVTLESFGGLSVPAGTPAPVVKRLAEALQRCLANADVRTRLEAQGGIASPGTPEEYTQALRREIDLAEQMMRVAKLEPQ